MRENYALPIYLAILGLEVTFVALTVFRRWHEDSLIKIDQDITDDTSGSVAKETVQDGLRRRKNPGGGTNGKQMNVDQSADKTKTAKPPSNVFNVFDGDLSFVTDRGNQPGLCYHAGELLV